MLARQIRAFGADERGATAVEYGLLIGLISIALLAAFTLLGNSIQDLFNNGAVSAIAAQANAPQ